MKKTELTIGVPKEISVECRCVALIPEVAQALIRKGHPVLVESGAGEKAYQDNEKYRQSGARIIDDAGELYGSADVIFKKHPPAFRPIHKKHELDMMKEGATILSFLTIENREEVDAKLRVNKLTGFAMEMIPRISRAQNMDVLSSLSTVAGYRAAVLASYYLGRFFPLFMTAAGTVQPANVLVIGAGVAGLQAIATAHRLGARVQAFDPRPAVKEQIESLGARFIEMELPPAEETRYGYAKEISQEFIRKEMEAISQHLPRTDVVITTALLFGSKAPILITGEMAAMMKPGSVIIDIAAEQGGNCELTEKGKSVEKSGVTIYGPEELPSQMPYHASLMYSKNLVNAFENLYAGEDDTIDLNDEINSNALLTYKGEPVSKKGETQ